MEEVSPTHSDGFGIIETLIAVIVLGLLVVSIGNFIAGNAKSTGESRAEVTAAGLARFELSYWQQQLESDNQYDFPQPFPCAITQGAATTPICVGQNVTSANGTSGTNPPANEYSYCTPLGSAATSPTCGTPSTTASASSAVDAYTVTTTAAWQCNPGSKTDTGNLNPYLLVQVQVIWPDMGAVSPISVSASFPTPGGILPDNVSQALPQASATLGANVPDIHSPNVSNTGNNQCAS